MATEKEDNGFCIVGELCNNPTYPGSDLHQAYSDADTASAACSGLTRDQEVVEE